MADMEAAATLKEMPELEKRRTAETLLSADTQNEMECWTDSQSEFNERMRAASVLVDMRMRKLLAKYGFKKWDTKQGTKVKLEQETADESEQDTGDESEQEKEDETDAESDAVNTLQTFPKPDRSASKAQLPTPSITPPTPNRKSPSLTPPTPHMDLSDDQPPSKRRGARKSASPKSVSTTVSTPSSGGTRKRKAEDNTVNPRRKYTRVGGVTPGTKGSYQERFGGRVKMTLTARGEDLKTPDANQRIFTIGLGMHPKDGPGSERYNEECKMAAAWGFTGEKGNMAVYYNMKDRWFEGTAMLLEHNLRASRRNPSFTPLRMNKANTQVWLTKDVKRSCTMREAYVAWGWIPPVIRGEENTGKVTEDTAIIDKFCSPEKRKMLYDQLVEYDEAHHPDNLIMVRE